MAAQDYRSRVLLVEDEFLLCDMLTEALGEHGFEVHAVATADAAIRHLREGAPCDVLITDINLPGSADGPCCRTTNVQPPRAIAFDASPRFQWSSRL